MRGVRIKDQISKVAVYVATKDPSLRKRLETRRRELILFEKSFQFDPDKSNADFELLKSLLAPN
jgi:hypothetical protein